MFRSVIYSLAPSVQDARVTASGAGVAKPSAEMDNRCSGSKIVASRLNVAKPTRRYYQTPYLVAEHYDRFLRHPSFGPKNPFVIPTREQAENVHKACQANNMVLATLYPTSLGIRDLARARSRRGKKLHGMTLRAYKHNRRSMLLPIAKEMKDRGLSLSEIAQNLYLPNGTVRYWSSVW